jgi:hypothetical protein
MYHEESEDNALGDGAAPYLSRSIRHSAWIYAQKDS